MLLLQNRRKSGVQKYQPSAVGMELIAFVMDRKVAKNRPGAAGTGSIVTVEIHKLVLNHPRSGVQKPARDALGMGINVPALSQVLPLRQTYPHPLLSQEKCGVLK